MARRSTASDGSDMADITDSAKPDAISTRITINLFRSINAPLKLVVVRNRDFTLVDSVFRSKIEEASRLQGIEQQLIARDYGECSEARQRLNQAEDAGIVLLDEGNYDFRLDNGVWLKVYASPFTPSLGD